MKLKLPEKGVLYQFILAIEESYPDYARVVRRDMRSKGSITLDSMIQEINDEARRDDPVKTASFAVKRQHEPADSKENNSRNSQQAGGDNRRGRGRGRGGHNGGARGGSNTVSNNSTNNTTNDSKPAPPYCKHCKREHWGAGDTCWHTFPHLASQEWRDRQAARNNQTTAPAAAATAAATINDRRNYSVSFDSSAKNDACGNKHFIFTSTSIDDNTAEVSGQTMRFAGRTEYKDRTIIDTGATDHICNNYDRFITFERESTCSAIKTGAGIVQVKATGTIELSVLQSNGVVNVVRFSKVLYAPDMFVSIISHSKIRQKGIYYHGWDEKIYRKSDTCEIAYTPEIDGIPNFLQTRTELKAA